MRRNVIFEKGRAWRPEDDRVNDLRFEAGEGARAGEYDPYVPAEYSDSYYGPGDDYARREIASGYNRGETHSLPSEHAPPARIAGSPPPARWGSNRLYGETQSYGELHSGERSWADLGVSSVHPGESGITEHRRSFRGRGPKGYRRSDERIAEIVCDLLTDDPRIDAAAIDLQVKDGEITLTGTVTDRRVKRMVEESIDERLGGNVEIHNQLKCVPMMPTSVR